jgi:hypothetical protein
MGAAYGGRALTSANPTKSPALLWVTSLRRRKKPKRLRARLYAHLQRLETSLKVFFTTSNFDHRLATPIHIPNAAFWRPMAYKRLHSNKVEIQVVSDPVKPDCWYVHVIAQAHGKRVALSGLRTLSLQRAKRLGNLIAGVDHECNEGCNDWEEIADKSLFARRGFQPQEMKKSR